MEIIYLKIKKYKNIVNEEFNLSANYKCKLHNETLFIDEIKNNINIFPQKIKITTIVGENGTGKTSLLEVIINFFINSFKDNIIVFKTETDLFSNHENIEFDGKVNIFNPQFIPGRNNNYFSIITNTSDFQNNEFFLNRELSFYENLHPMHIKENVFELHNDMLKLDFNNLYAFESALVFNSLLFNKSTIFNPTEYQIQLNPNYLIYKLFDILLYNDSLIELEEKILFKKTENFVYQLFNNISIKEIIKLYLFLTKEEKGFKNKKYPFYLKEIIENIKNNDNKYLHFLDLTLFDTYFSLNLDNFINLFNSVYKKNQFSNVSKNKTNLIELSKNNLFNELIGKLFTINLKDDYRKYSDLSYGERSSLIQEGLFYKNIITTKNKNVLILLDENSISFHPNWQKQNLNSIINYLEQFTNINFHLIITTHSPFMLSDLPKENVIFLEKNNENGNCINSTEKMKSFNTFGANIHTLFSHGFFMKNGLIGEFAKNKINDVINFINGNKSSIKTNDEAQNLINIIGEPVIKNQLQKMLDSKKFSYIDEIDSIENQIEKLSKRVEELKNGKN